jgi:hypothetical protein
VAGDELDEDERQREHIGPGSRRAQARALRREPQVERLSVEPLESKVRDAVSGRRHCVAAIVRPANGEGLSESSAASETLTQEAFEEVAPLRRRQVPRRIESLDGNGPTPKKVHRTVDNGRAPRCFDAFDPILAVENGVHQRIAGGLADGRARADWAPDEAFGLHHRTSFPADVVPAGG